jgi:hypothetical protein
MNDTPAGFVRLTEVNANMRPVQQVAEWLVRREEIVFVHTRSRPSLVLGEEGVMLTRVGMKSGGGIDVAESPEQVLAQLA